MSWPHDFNMGAPNEVTEPSINRLRPVSHLLAVVHSRAVESVHKSSDSDSSIFKTSDSDSAIFKSPTPTLS
jgi:hypothetical protein